MATPPSLHALCDACWKKTPGGIDGMLPHRLHQISARLCCLCGITTTSGIYIEDDPALYLCKGSHPMTDEELKNSIEAFMSHMFGVAERTCTGRHQRSAADARIIVADAADAVLLHYRVTHEVPTPFRVDASPGAACECGREDVHFHRPTSP